VLIKWIQRAHNGCPEKGGTFVDLGSGSGKALLTAALIHNWENVVGIEMLEDLCEEAGNLQKFYEQ